MKKNISLLKSLGVKPLSMQQNLLNKLVKTFTHLSEKSESINSLARFLSLKRKKKKHENA